MTSGETPGWSALQSETLCQTPWLQVTRDRVATSSRPQGVEWMIAHRPTAAVVAPRTDDGRFVLVRQERVAVRRVLWEFPAGMVDGGVSENAILETRLFSATEFTAMIASGEIVDSNTLASFARLVSRGFLP